MVILIGEALEIVEHSGDDAEVGMSAGLEYTYLPIEAAEHLGDTLVLLPQFIQELRHDASFTGIPQIAVDLSLMLPRLGVSHKPEAPASQGHRVKEQVTNV